MPKYKYVNASNVTIHLPDVHGGRLALAPGQFVTDPYYDRFSRFPHEKDRPNRALIKVAIDGGDLEPSVQPPKPRAPVSLRPNLQDKVKFTPPPPPPVLAADGRCLAACESACMTIQEFCVATSPAKDNEVPEYMRRSRAKSETGSTDSTGDVETVELVSLVQDEDKSVADKVVIEKDISAIVGKDIEANTEAVVSESKEASVVSNSGDEITRVTTEELLEKYGYTKSDISKDDKNYVFIAKEGHLRYLSKLDPNFSCTKRSEILKHVERMLGRK